MKREYDHKKIEKKWQDFWEDKKIFQVKADSNKPKFYVLDMFPYPSGAGLHVGHVAGYTATDIVARYRRMKGYNVLHPMGWDSFGLPAEQYALRTGTHPSITTQLNIDTYRGQLKAMGFSYDWSREITTSDPSYYKWTQWIFTRLYAQGLAYEAEVEVNFSPQLGTVLANEEVENGYSKEGGYKVEKRALRQWMLKISSYAERLIDDLKLVDWPESLKRLQINWIGKSEGVEIDFEVEGSTQLIKVFTTRPETLFGVTYLVVAPEHPIVMEIVSKEQRDELVLYQKLVSEKTEIERTDASREKSGVWSGAYAINPANNMRIPIWVSDYVLITYGTGSVMGVPSHDERDFEFAKKMALPIVAVISPDNPDSVQSVMEGAACWIGDGRMVHSGFLDALSVAEAKSKIVEWLTENKRGKPVVYYKIRDWLFSRQRYWGEPFPIIHLEDGTKRILGLDELPLLPPELSDYRPSGSGASPLSKAKEWMELFDLKSGQKGYRESNTMPQWAGSCWYYLRFSDPHNFEKAWGEKEERYWLPVDLYVGGVEHAVLHLLYARFWHKVLYDCGYVSTLEPFYKLRNQGLVLSRSYQLASGVYVAPEDVIEKEGHYYQSGTLLPLRSQIEKMSKSKLNGVSPEIMLEEYGADSLRLYEMFMGPFEQEKIWDTRGVQGCYRFLNRFYRIATSEKLSEKASHEALQMIHRLIYHLQKDIESFSFNTAIAKMMEFVNKFISLEEYPREVVQMATQLLYPFAPHIAEEIWQLLGGASTIAFSSFPKVNFDYVKEESCNYVVQVNGKTRGVWKFLKESGKEELVDYLSNQPRIKAHLKKEVQRVIFIPNKLVNFVLLDD